MIFVRNFFRSLYPLYDRSWRIAVRDVKVFQPDQLLIVNMRRPTQQGKSVHLRFEGSSKELEQMSSAPWQPLEIVKGFSVWSIPQPLVTRTGGLPYIQVKKHSIHF